MFAATLSSFWSSPKVQEATRPPKPRRAASPLFIGDAVQPWAGETMLLALLREDQENDQP